jgi:hypothetical protein
MQVLAIHTADVETVREVLHLNHVSQNLALSKAVLPEPTWIPLFTRLLREHIADVATAASYRHNHVLHKQIRQTRENALQDQMEQLVIVLCDALTLHYENEIQ